MSDKELELASDQLLIVKTDANGKFTYCNQSFIQIFGYQEQQILGQHFESIKHQDMPKGIYHLLWDTVKQKREFNGYLKICTNNGNHYWTFANITPFYDSIGSIAGYTCALRHPNLGAVTMFAMYYEQMREEEQITNDAKASLNQLIELLSAMGDDYEASVFKLQFS